MRYTLSDRDIENPVKKSSWVVVDNDKEEVHRFATKPEANRFVLANIDYEPAHGWVIEHDDTRNVDD